MRIQDVMSKKVITVAPEANVASARETLHVNEIDHLVVMSGKKIVGVIAGKDVLGAGDNRTVADVMSRDVVTIEPDATMRHAAGVMRGRGVGCLPVVDDGRLAGIVTTSDLLTALAKGETHAAQPAGRVILRRRGPRKRQIPI